MPRQGWTIVAYVRTPLFIGVRMILDMRTMTRTLIFSCDFFKFLIFFLFFSGSGSLKT